MTIYHVNGNGEIIASMVGRLYPGSDLFSDFESAKKRAAELLAAKMRADKQKISNLQMEIENAESGIKILESLPESEFNGYWSAF